MIEILTGQDLKSARESLNLLQAKIAKDIGLNRSYLSQFESEQR
ncbi:MAG: helix-turn-helix domain-containing protein [Pseudomonadales bacterium]|nr:helix-turn-helix domain-containing protein [Pseudomonadales bacterium]